MVECQLFGTSYVTATQQTQWLLHSYTTDATATSQLHNRHNSYVTDDRRGLSDNHRHIWLDQSIMSPFARPRSTLTSLRRAVGRRQQVSTYPRYIFTWPSTPPCKDKTFAESFSGLPFLLAIKKEIDQSLLLLRERHGQATQVFIGGSIGGRSASRWHSRLSSIVNPIFPPVIWRQIHNDDGIR